MNIYIFDTLISIHIHRMLQQESRLYSFNMPGNFSKWYYSFVALFWILGNNLWTYLNVLYKNIRSNKKNHILENSKISKLIAYTPKWQCFTRVMRVFFNKSLVAKLSCSGAKLPGMTGLTKHAVLRKSFNFFVSQFLNFKMLIFNIIHITKCEIIR